ncbi:lysophospholipid acyltransferase family protein [candidate division KSB1 bacterium]|nr:lysophospholipid acyltransferase family protein [candidate division KSB1 bacterium]
MSSFRRLRKKLKNDLIFVIVSFVFRFINRIQRDTAFRIFTTLGTLAYFVTPGERRKTITHLTQVLGESHSHQKIEKIAKLVFRNLGRNMVDAFRIGTMNSTIIDGFVTANGLEHLDAAMAKGNGVLAITGHIGNWELFGAYLAFKGYPLYVIGAPIYDPRLDEMVVKNRMASGAGYIARGRATREILRTLKRNGVIGILIDQDSRKNDGIFVDFLGIDAYTPVGPIILALKTNASIVPMAIHIKRDNTHVVNIKPELPLIRTGDENRDIYENTLQCSKALEEFILDSPTQWVWMHERWKTKPADIKT